MVGAAVAESSGCKCVDACLLVRQADQISLYVEFQNLELTASFVERAHAKQMPPEINSAFQQLLAGVSPELNAYACYVPAEALALLKEADFQALLKHALANPCTAPALGQPQAGGVAALGLP